MKIRTQLALAFLVLAVLPLSVIVVYSYTTSLRAVRAAEEAEASQLAGELDERLDDSRQRLAERIGRFGGFELPAGMESEGGAAMAGGLAEELLFAMGDAAPLVRSLEFVPEPAARSVTPSVSEVPEVERVAPTQPVAPTPPASAAPDPPSAPAAAGRIVIDVARILRELEAEGLDESEQAQAVAGIESAMEVSHLIVSSLGRVLPAEVARELAEVSSELQEEREQLQAELEAHREHRPTEFELRRLGAEEDRSIRRAARAERLAGARLEDGFDVPVLDEAGQVGRFEVAVSGEELLKRVLQGELETRPGDIPFAFDSDGNLHSPEASDLPLLRELTARLDSSYEEGSQKVNEEWVVVTTATDSESGIVFGVARPIAASLAGVRRTAVSNLGYGLGLILLALLGILPLSRRMTRNLDAVIAGAERISKGDLNVRVPASTGDEFGRLGKAFNRMAVELLDQQVQIVEQERLRREHEVREHLLQSDNARKTEELEEARRFQLSLLPKTLPEIPGLELAVAMRTATEVGGDYYDFHVDDDGSLTLAIGDATGHGARAGTMVTVIKSLFSAHVGSRGLSLFLGEATRAIRRMELGRMFMALTLARFRPGEMTVAAAGMPPVLICRGGEEVEELEIEGMPLGGMSWDYRSHSVALQPGDTVLFASDGFPELLDRAGQPFGYARVSDHFRRHAEEGPQGLVDSLLAAADRWRGEQDLSDDLTLVVVKLGPAFGA